MQKVRWAVIGQARAGKARVRELGAADDAELVAALSARALGPPPADAREVAGLAQAQPQAVVIATANADHAAWAAACLRAGWHVLVEFPLCASIDEATTLFALARQQQRVLHVEFIGLLTAAHARFRSQVQGAGLRHLQSEFSGGLYSWLADEVAQGRCGQLAVGRLQALWQIAGPLDLVSVDFTRRGEGYDLRAMMSGRGGSVVALQEARRPGLTRRGRLQAELADGSTVVRGSMEPGEALFAADLRACSQRIHSGDERGAYVGDTEIAAVVALAAAISAACK